MESNVVVFFFVFFGSNVKFVITQILTWLSAQQGGFGAP